MWNRQNSKTSNIATKSTPSTSTEKSESKPVIKAEVKGGYLYISEWGIKGKWPAELSDVTISLINDGTDGAPMTIRFDSKKVQEEITNIKCGDTCDVLVKLGFMVMDREKTPMLGDGSTYSQESIDSQINDGILKHTGSYYYRAHATGALLDDSTPEKKQAIDLMNSYLYKGLAFFKSLETL